MYRTSHSIRILSAALAAVFGLGLVATAGGALREERAPTKAEALQVMHLEPVVVKLHPAVAAFSGVRTGTEGSTLDLSVFSSTKARQVRAFLLRHAVPSNRDLCSLLIDKCNLSQ